MIQYTDRITPEEYMELRRKVGWMEFAMEEAKACVENAYFVICVREDEKAIGVVRLLWDGGYVAFLSDLVVDPAYQGQGIGRKLDLHMGNNTFILSLLPAGLHRHQLLHVKMSVVGTGDHGRAVVAGFSADKYCCTGHMYSFSYNTF